MENQTAYQTAVHQLLLAHFDAQELQTLCFKLGVVFDDLPGTGRVDKAREMVLYLQRRGRLVELEAAIRLQRPFLIQPQQPLPPDLSAEIVELLAPLAVFSLPAGRRAALAPIFNDWPAYVLLDYNGGPRKFCEYLVYILPGEQTKQLLHTLLDDIATEGQVTRLCAAIDAVLQLHAVQTSDPFYAYHDEIAARLASPAYQIDRRFVQLTLLIDQGPDVQGLRFTTDKQHGRFDSLQTLLAAVNDRALVLLGGPGSGKTTLLRRLQLERAWAELKAPGGQTTFFLPLNAFRGLEPGTPAPEPFDWLASEWRLRHPGLPPFETLYKNGRFLLLLDGLNEMPHGDKTEYRAQIGRWQRFLRRTHHYGSTVIFSCRSLDYSAPLGSEAVPVRQVQVEPLSPQQIHAFLTAYLGDAGAAVWAALQAEAQLDLYANPFYLRLLTEEVGETGRRPSGRAALLTAFVRRALRREIERGHALFEPDNLLSEGDCLQVIQHAWATPYALPEEGVLLPHLAQLAYQMQDDRAAGDAGQVRVLEPTAHNLLNHSQARDILAAALQLHLLDKDIATREVTFYHQLVQEYFAARVLAQTQQPGRVWVPWHVDAVTPSLAETIAALEVSEPLPALPTTGWEETTLLAAALAVDQDDFVDGLYATNLVLAARCAAAPEVGIAPQLVAELQQALLARIGSPAADLRGRIAAAEALAELGDPRFERRTGPHGAYLLPPLAAIPAGKYTIGDDDSQYADEKPAHQVQIATFEIGVFPVTNAEYALFIEAGGYDEERWWQTEAAKAWLQGQTGSEGQKTQVRDVVALLQNWSEDDIRAQPNFTPEQIDAYLWLKRAASEQVERLLEEWFPSGQTYHQPEFWDDSRFKHPAQPVVGISWFEACAYCAWLSAQSGRLFRLPTEVEWEAAARGFEGRQYAYGPRFDDAHCNTFETHIRRTTPVGVFPGGYTPEGIADLSGNVWEWTSTLWGESFQRPTFAYPYAAEDGREEPENATASRALRGGSWSLTVNFVRASSRDYYQPNYRGDYFGFRLVCARGCPSH
ncbi:MAG: SUMF1/EgtB/PvdO family nonheme iron enzyme, partial [Anaerolineales bacterium]|nr:SUMF1/EgtB/PvdO family nonheme iron enzyme [Anaerolineales bacterium]